MQRVAPVDHHPVEHAVHLLDLFEQDRIAADVAGRRGVAAAAFLVQLAEVRFAALRIDIFETGRAMAVEGRAAPVAAEQLLHRRQPVLGHRIDVRDPLQ